MRYTVISIVFSGIFLRRDKGNFPSYESLSLLVLAFAMQGEDLLQESIVNPRRTLK
jgi:hypothetical protein